MSAGLPVVLVVDDEPLHRWIAREALDGTCTVIEADGGEAALEAVRAHPVDLVLLDVRMPGMDGLATIPRLRALEEGRWRPIVLCTFLGDPGDRVAGLAAGADDYVNKPVDPAELRLRVGGLLTRRRQEAQIRDQLRSLQDLDDLKDDLVSLVVHDLRNPLTALMMLLDLFGLPDAVRPEDIESARASALRMKELLESLLEVRELEDGDFPVLRAPTPLARLVEEAIAAVGGRARARDITIHHDADPADTAAIDRRLLQRALENLLSNALQYAPVGSTVQVGTAHPPGRLVITVADRGPGLSLAARAHLFEKFGGFASRPTAGPRRGFGLGLYQVRLAAAAHGGSVQVEDNPGGGALFRLTVADVSPEGGP